MKIMMGVIAVFFFGGALLNIVAPRMMWRARTWQYKNREALEPSDAALVVQRVFGVVALVAGAVFFSFVFRQA